jgi:hypothetical protein
MVKVLLASSCNMLNENCIYSSVFARHWPINTINVVNLVTRQPKNIVNSVVLGFRDVNNISIYDDPLALENITKGLHTTYLMIFGHCGTKKKPHG